MNEDYWDVTGKDANSRPIDRITEQQPVPTPALMPAKTRAARDKQAAEPPVQLYGMQLIHKMSKQDMIEEFLAWQRNQLETSADEHTLRHLVVQCRVQTYQSRLTRESGCEPDHGGILGAGW